MSGLSQPADQKRRWYELGLRHMRMASRLLEAGFHDGAVFHTYHAYECVLSAFIAAHGYQVPPEGWTTVVTPSGRTVSLYPSPGGGVPDRSAHRARQIFFTQLAGQQKAYALTHRVLSRFLTVSSRNDALYYDAVRDRLPQETFTPTFARSLLPQIRHFGRAIWRDIR